ncbi:predicted protein [Naegleria gruberi]|uniref:Predicted protein n=1 Tax=Naegleria gruberi TaxID=5762 RepID=D2VAI9_NAEGR|nr:uncharacterized protein NAEGRDRAFT_65874 [Naegleria gruberi]EFC46082.1 predicted protein [Naegleria gruberi]|eukprot:XP_002678826.1 predicted protein [Naegleria gruberi strain NEG-M]
MGNTASFNNQYRYDSQHQQPPSATMDDQQLERVAEMLKRSLLGDAITLPAGMSPREYFSSSKHTKSSAILNGGVNYNSKINKIDLKPMRGYASCNELLKAGEKYNAETPTTSSEGSTTSDADKDDTPTTSIKRSKNSMSTPTITKNNSLLIPKKLNPIKIPNSLSNNTVVVPFIKVESPDIVISSSTTPKETIL